MDNEEMDKELREIRAYQNLPELCKNRKDSLLISNKLTEVVAQLSYNSMKRDSEYLGRFLAEVSDPNHKIYKVTEVILQKIFDEKDI